MSDPRTEFFAALAAAGVAPASPSALVADGRLHRHHIDGDRPGSRNGWHTLHLDPPASGAGGSWKSSASIKWCSKHQSALTASERAEMARRITEDRKRAQEAQEARYMASAAKAVRVWSDAAPASAQHPYLLKKMVAPGVARQSGDNLILPVTDFDGRLTGLQFIAPDGSKRFLTGMKKAGGFIRTGEMPSADSKLVIAEGWATAQTLAALSPQDVVISALDAGNLQPVACEARRRWPLLEIVVAADADPVGMEKARAAAFAARAKWIWPRFPDGAPKDLSDFNDWYCWRKRGVGHAE